MPLARPQFIVLDSATLGKVSRDYWSPSKKSRDKASTFVTRLSSQNVFITFTITHILELLGHENETVVRDRLKFLRILPLVAWLRPYDFNGLPGGIPDLLRHELHAVVHERKHDWRAITEQVGKNLWETGLGSEMFGGDDDLWSILRIFAQIQLDRKRHVASVTRTDPGHIHDLTYGESKQLKKRPKAERVAYMRRFAAKMKIQLEQHGDRRLESPQDVAVSFTNDTMKDTELIDAAGGDPIQQILEFHRVPLDLVTDEMTVDDIGQLAVYIKQLADLSKNLNPRRIVTVYDVPPETLPSYVLEHRLAKIQRKATRVSGSDFGDGHIAPLVLYADGVEVDKRTYEYLTQVQRSCPKIAELMGRFFRSSDYAEIPNYCDIAA